MGLPPDQAALKDQADRACRAGDFPAAAAAYARLVAAWGALPEARDDAKAKVFANRALCYENQGARAAGTVPGRLCPRVARRRRVCADVKLSTEPRLYRAGEWLRAFEDAVSAVSLHPAYVKGA